MWMPLDLNYPSKHHYRSRTHIPWQRHFPNGFHMTETSNKWTENHGGAQGVDLASKFPIRSSSRGTQRRKSDPWIPPEMNSSWTWAPHSCCQISLNPESFLIFCPRTQLGSGSGIHVLPRNPDDLLQAAQWLVRGLSARLQGMFSQICFFSLFSFHYQWSVRRWTAVSQTVFAPCNRTAHPRVAATRQTKRYGGAGSELFTLQVSTSWLPRCRISLWLLRSSSNFAVIAKTDLVIIWQLTDRQSRISLHASHLKKRTEVVRRRRTATSLLTLVKDASVEKEKKT